MKRLAIGFVALLALSALFPRAVAAESESAVLTPRIEHVTVLRDKAEVELTAEVDIPAGDSTVMLDPLFPAPDMSSLRVKVEAEGAVTVHGLDYTRVPVPKPPLEAYAELANEIEALERDIAKLEADRVLYGTLARDASALLDGIRKMASSGMGRGKPLPEGFKAQVEFLAARKLDYTLKADETERKAAELKRKLRILREKLDAVYPGREKYRPAAAVRLSATAAAKGRITLKFFVPDCSWSPSYIADVNTTTGKLAVRYSATVVQRTGIDWNGVALTLATASPLASIAPPEPGPWVVTRKVLPLRRGFAGGADRGAWRKKALEKLRKEEAEVEEDAMTAAEPAARHVTAAASSEGALGVSFSLPERVSVKSGAPKKLTVGFLEMDASVKRTLIPRLSTAVFMTAEADNSTAFPLLPGPVQCFLDGMLLGRTAVGGVVQPGSKLKLPLGVDRRVKVKYVTVEDKYDERSKTIRHYLAWRIEVENAAGRAVLVELKDHVPVSQNDDLRVKIGKLSPKPDKQTAEGILTWKLDLEPGAKKVVEIAFYIEYPKGTAPVEE